jgi:hypothetical protein
VRLDREGRPRLGALADPAAELARRSRSGGRIVNARIAHGVILGGALAFLASLYLTWISATPIPVRNGSGIGELLNLLAGGSANGWGIFGEAAALAAIALIVLVLVALGRPELVGSIPFGGCAIALGALALVNAAALRTSAIYRSDGHISVHLSTGAYIGGAAALVVLLGAGLTSSDEPAETGLATILAATLLTAGLVAAYVLPTFGVQPYQSTGPGGFQFVQGGSFGTAVMLLIGSFGLTFWLGAAPLRRLSTAAVVLVLTVGGFSPYGTHAHWPYEAWLAIGCAAGLLVLALATDGMPHLSRPTRPHALALEGAALVLVSLFFNWEKLCPYREPCFVWNGWTGGLTGGLVAILVVLILGFGCLSPELAITVGIYAVGTGLAITAHASLGYGAYLGFAGAALLLLAVAMQRGTLSFPRFRIVPIVACLAFVAIPALAMTRRIEELTIWRPWFLTLFEAAAIVVAVRLCGRWLAGRAGDVELLVLPITLLALTALNVGEMEHVFRVHWEGWLGLGLCAFLILCAFVERSSGLPEEIWRVDRLPVAED